MKLWKNIICFTVALILLVQPFFSFSHVKAQGLPNPSSIEYRALDADYGTVKATMNFSGASPIVFNFGQRANLSQQNLVDNMGTVSNIYTYKMTNPVGVCSYYDYSETGAAATSPVYLVVTKASATANYIQQGIALVSPTDNKYHIQKDRGTGCASAGIDLTVFAHLIMISSASTSRVMPFSNITDVAAYCTSLSADWTNLKNSMRSILIPPPNSPEGNTNWISRPGGEMAIPWKEIAPLWAQIIVDEGSGDAQFQLFNHSLTDTTINYDLNGTGIEALRSAYQLTQSIKAKIEQLRSQFDENTWPANCVKLKKFKYVLSLEEAPNAQTYASLKEFGTHLGLAIANFTRFITITDEPVTSAESSVCDSDIKGNGISSMIEQAFCGLLVVLKDWADSLFKTAEGFLKASLGVTKNEKIELASDITTPADSTGNNTSIQTATPITVPPPLVTDLTAAANTAGGSFTAKLVTVGANGTNTNTQMAGTVKVNSTTPPTLSVSAAQALTAAKYNVYFNAGNKGYTFQLTKTGTSVTASTLTRRDDLYEIPAPAAAAATPAATPATTPTTPAAAAAAPATPAASTAQGNDAAAINGTFSLYAKVKMSVDNYNAMKANRSNGLWAKIGSTSESKSNDIVLTHVSVTSWSVFGVKMHITANQKPPASWTNVWVRGGAINGSSPVQYYNFIINNNSYNNGTNYIDFTSQ